MSSNWELVASLIWRRDYHSYKEAQSYGHGSDKAKHHQVRRISPYCMKLHCDVCPRISASPPNGATTRRSACSSRSSIPPPSA